MLSKILDENQRKAIVWDVERGAPNEIMEQPWQSCSCIGGWHYNTSIYENNWYKSAADVVKLLVDIVSKMAICCSVFHYGLMVPLMKRRRKY